MLTATTTYTLTCDWHRERGEPVIECRAKLVIHGETKLVPVYARARREGWTISFYGGPERRITNGVPQRVVTRCPEHTHEYRRVPTGRPARRAA